MALIMLEEKHVVAANGERKIIKKGDPVPKEYVAAWAGKPFVKDTDAKPAPKKEAEK